MMMLESKQCFSCHKRKVTALKSGKNTISGISEIKIMNKPILLTDSSILFCVINGYDTVSKIRKALDNAFYNKNSNDLLRRDKIIFGGRTEGNLRARLKVLDQLGLVVANLSPNNRIPSYTITNLGLAVNNVFMAGIDLFNRACSDCITEKMQKIVKDLFRPGQNKEELSF